jgi:hypothetical protein
LHNSKLFPDEFKRDIRYFLKYNLDRNEYTINETVIKTKSNVINPEIASEKFQVDQNLCCMLYPILAKENAENKLNLLSLAAQRQTDTIVIANEKAVWANQAYLDLTGLAMEEVWWSKTWLFI